MSPCQCLCTCLSVSVHMCVWRLCPEAPWLTEQGLSHVGMGTRLPGSEHLCFPSLWVGVSLRTGAGHGHSILGIFFSLMETHFCECLCYECKELEGEGPLTQCPPCPQVSCPRRAARVRLRAGEPRRGCSGRDAREPEVGHTPNVPTENNRDSETRPRTSSPCS